MSHRNQITTAQAIDSIIRFSLTQIYHEASGSMGSFYQDVITTDSRFASPLRCFDLALLEPVTRTAVQALLAAAKSELGKDLMVWETYRSQIRQAALFAQGATTLRTVGVHHYGLACDIVYDVAGSPSWKGDFTFLGVLSKRFGFVWGGDWGQPDIEHSFRDYDHVQRCTLADQSKLFAGEWYPGLDYGAI